MDKWTDGQMDNWTDDQTDEMTGGQTDKQLHMIAHIKTRGLIDGWTERQTEGEMNMWTDEQNVQIDLWKNRQAGRWIDRQSEGRAGQKIDC